MFRRVLVTAALLCAMGSVAEAGVAGNTYAGTITNRNGDVGNVCLEFDNSGGWTLSRQFPGDPGPQSFNGSYTETDLVLFSIVNAGIGRRRISGFEALGLVTLNVAGAGGGVAAQCQAFLSGCDIGPTSEVVDSLPPSPKVAARDERTAPTLH